MSVSTPSLSDTASSPTYIIQLTHCAQWILISLPDSDILRICILAVCWPLIGHSVFSPNPSPYHITYNDNYYIQFNNQNSLILDYLLSLEPAQQWVLFAATDSVAAINQVTVSMVRLP